MELIKKYKEQLTAVTNREEIIESNLEIIVPQEFSEILRVVGVYGNLEFSEKNVQADKIMLNGMCQAKILCMTEEKPEGEIIEATIPISHMVQINKCDSECIAVIDCQLCECNATIINAEKLQIKCKVKLLLEIYKKSELWLTTGVKEKDLHTLYKDYENHYISNIAEKQLRVVESISIDDSALVPLKWETEFISEDIKLVKNKLMIRGNCRLKVMLFNKISGEIVREKYHLPYSVIIENDGFNENQNMEVRYTCQNTEVTLGKSEENTILNCDSFANISVLCKDTIEEKLLCDAFSNSCEVQIVCEELLAKVDKECTKQSYNISHTANEITDAYKICDFTYCVSADKVKEKLANIILNLDVMYKDIQGEIYSKWLKCCFEVQTEEDFKKVCVALENMTLECLENGNVKIEGKAELTLCDYEETKLMQIVKGEILKDVVKSYKNNASLILRNIGEHETIRDIAKKYNTSPTAILQANKLENSEKLTQGKLIMIPIVK